MELKNLLIKPFLKPYKLAAGTIYTEQKAEYFGSLLHCFYSQPLYKKVKPCASELKLHRIYCGQKRANISTQSCLFSALYI